MPDQDALVERLFHARRALKTSAECRACLDGAVGGNAKVRVRSVPPILQV